MATATAARPPQARRLRAGAWRRTLAPRAAIVVLALLAAAVVLRDGIATRLVRTDPTRAADVAPYDARISVAAARAAVNAGAAVQSPGVRRLVDRALARDATIPAAVELRALAAAASGDHRREARLFALSDAISRRSLPTRLWLIQRSVDAGDVQGALGQFDIALRTSTAAPEVLFPVLARASADPALAGPIARLLDRKSDWRIAFLHYAVTDGHAAPDIARVVVRMRDRSALVRARIDQALVGELVAEEAFLQARDVYDAFHPRRTRAGLVRDPDFSDAGAVFPFGWALTERGEAGATRSTIGGRPTLAYQSQVGGSGAVATQLLLLEPGGYSLSVRTATPPTEADAAPYWTVTCGQDGGGQLALLEQPTGAGAWASVEFTVPPGCPAQWIALILRPSDGGASSGSIAAVALRRH